MRLQEAINKSVNCQGFCEIFEKRVKTELDLFWGLDSVSVEGYEGSVSTHFIAQQILGKFHLIKEEEEKSALALSEFLTNKVFIPLRDRLMESDRASCGLSTLTYKIRNCSQMCWVPSDRRLTAGYGVLNHSMCVMFLNKSI